MFLCSVINPSLAPARREGEAQWLERFRQAPVSLYRNVLEDQLDQTIQIPAYT